MYQSVLCSLHVDRSSTKVPADVHVRLVCVSGNLFQLRLLVVPDGNSQLLLAG